MSTKPNSPAKKRERPFRPRILWNVVRTAGLVPMTIIFAALFFLLPLVIMYAEPSMETYGDSLWFMYTVVTTIGLGDFTCTTILGRTCCILISFYAMFYLALVTGAVVNYCNQRFEAHRNLSIAEFLDKLERLPELSHEELVELSDRIKRLR